MTWTNHHNGLKTAALLGGMWSLLLLLGYALTNATLPYALALADDGWRRAIEARPDLARGLSTHAGALYTTGVGEALGIPTADVADLLG